MNKILIISPHYPPSNLAAVHRSRLFAQHLPEFGWEPIVLTVHEDFYEEKLDWNLHQLLPTNQRIEKCAAFKISKPRLIGDIGLRAFFQLYSKAKWLIKNEKIDFLYIPIPSFYIALLGRWLNHSTGIKYGIDYIDPWVHEFPGSKKTFSRHWWSTKISKFLEPIAIKNVSLITGVAEGYYLPVLKRNPNLKNRIVHGAMPYGGEILDHQLLSKLNINPYLFESNNSKIQIVYAGAMLPKAYQPLEAIFKSIQEHKTIFETIEFHFIGTGSLPNDPFAFNIKPLAQKYGLWNTIVFEYPQRIPYLDVLVHLKLANAILILGSTEPHYTPSKSYQGILSEKPIFAILHQQSSAVDAIRNSNAGLVFDFDGELDVFKIEEQFHIKFIHFIEWMKSFKPNQVNHHVFDQYSAKSVTKKLSELLQAVH